MKRKERKRDRRGTDGKRFKRGDFGSKDIQNGIKERHTQKFIGFRFKDRIRASLELSVESDSMIFKGEFP